MDSRTLLSYLLPLTFYVNAHLTSAAAADAASAEEPPKRLPPPHTPIPQRSTNSTVGGKIGEFCLRFPTVEPTSEPLEVTVDDKSDTSVTITWRPPKTIPANSGLDGYTVEITKEGSKSLKPTSALN